MAKEGMDCFLLDCHTNDNIAEIEAEFGVKGFAVIVRLWQKIYSEKGYYCEWIERSPLLFLAQWFGGNSGVDLNLINMVVNKAIKIGIFNESMFRKYSILTSERIQEQYFNVVKRRTEIKAKKEYLLVSVVNFKGNVNIIEENVCRNQENVCRNGTSKVKVSKGKVSEGKERKEEPLHALTKQEYDLLISRHGQKKTNDYIERTIKYHCCNFETIEKWISEDKDKQGTKNKFNNFPQREYSSKEMSELERRLLEKSRSD